MQKRHDQGILPSFKFFWIIDRKFHPESNTWFHSKSETRTQQQTIQGKIHVLHPTFFAIFSRELNFWEGGAILSNFQQNQDALRLSQVNLAKVSEKPLQAGRSTANRTVETKFYKNDQNEVLWWFKMLLKNFAQKKNQLP